MTNRGDVYIFETDEKLIRDLHTPVTIVKSLFEEYEDIASPECITGYYSHHKYSVQNVC